MEDVSACKKGIAKELKEIRQVLIPNFLEALAMQDKASDKIQREGMALQILLDNIVSVVLFLVAPSSSL